MDNLIASVDSLLKDCDCEAGLGTGRDLELAQKALELSNSINYDIGIYESNIRIARALISCRKNEDAIKHLNICHSLANSLNDPERMAKVSNMFGIAYYKMGVISRSLEHFLETLEIAKSNGYLNIECQVYNNMCSILTELGDYKTALGYLNSLMEKIGDNDQNIFTRSFVYRNMAYTLYRMNMVDEARKYAHMALDEAIRQGSSQIICESYYTLGEICLSQDETEQAKELMLKALSLARELSSDYYLVQIPIDLSKLYCKIGNYDEAYRVISEAYIYAMKLDHPTVKRNAALALAEVCQYTNNMTMLVNALTTYKDITMKLEEENLRRQQVFIKAQLMLYNLKKDNERLRVEIERDPLTGCLSSRAFPDRIAQSLSAHGNKGALVFLDIDNLKSINDTYGHDSGDDLLKSFTRDLMKVMPRESLKIRISGDEFLVFIPNAGKEEASGALDKLLDTLAQPRKIGHVMLPVLVSAGIALYPDHSTDLVSLKKMADAAMYSAKQAGRGVYRIYNAS